MRSNSKTPKSLSNPLLDWFPKNENVFRKNGDVIRNFPKCEKITVLIIRLKEKIKQEQLNAKHNLSIFS